MTRSISSLPRLFPATQIRYCRGTKLRAEPVSVEIIENGVRGHGEALPYPRYGETVETVTATIEQMRGAVCAGMTRAGFANRSATRRGKMRAGLRAVGFGGQNQGNPCLGTGSNARPRAITTAFTVVLDGADTMAHAAMQQANFHSENQTGQP